MYVECKPLVPGQKGSCRRNRYPFNNSIESVVSYEEILTGFTNQRLKFVEKIGSGDIGSDRQYLPTNHDFVPTAMVNIGTWQIYESVPGRHDLLVLFFGPFYIIDSMFFLIQTNKTELTFQEMMQSHAVHLNNRWIGCPNDFCFEFDIDAAYSLENNEIILMAGIYDYSIDSWPPRKQPIQKRRRSWPRPEFNSYRGMAPTYAYRSKTGFKVNYGVMGYTYDSYWGKKLKLREFNDDEYIAQWDDIDVHHVIVAAVNYNDKIYYFRDKPVNISMDNKEGEPVVRNVLGSSIDAAFSFRETIVIISGNYYYNISFKDVQFGNMFSGPFPIFSIEYLMLCNGKMYQDNIHFTKYLNVTSKGDFYRFVNRFIQVDPYPEDRTTTTPSTTSTTKNKRSTGNLISSASPGTKSGVKWWIPVIVILAVVAAIMIGLIAYILIKKRKEKPKNETLETISFIG